MERDRIGELDVLKGVSILGVLVIHSSFDGRFSQEALSLQANLARLFDWAVLGFFFSSGVLHNPDSPLTTILKKRATTLLVPFFLYNLIYNLSFFALNALGWLSKDVYEMNSEPLLACPVKSPAFQLYFLPYLFIISTGVCGVEKLFSRFRNWTYVTALLLITLFYLCQGYPEMSHGPEFQKLPLYLAAFLLGIICRPFLISLRPKPLVVLAALVFALGLLAVLKYSVVSLLIPPLVVMLAMAFPMLKRNRPLILLGGMSGSIYLWHTPLMLPSASRLLAHLKVPSVCNLFLAIVLVLAACVFLRLSLNALFARVFHRGVPKWITL